MSHIDLGQPDLAAPRAAAGDAEFAEAQSRLLNSYGYRLGGVCLLAVPPEAGTAQGGISVSWTTHDLLLRDPSRYRIYRDTHQASERVVAGRPCSSASKLGQLKPLSIDVVAALDCCTAGTR